MVKWGTQTCSSHKPMAIKIIAFKERYADEMADLYTEVYSEPGAQWNKKTSKKYLERDYKQHPDYCYVAVDDSGKCVGAIFCAVGPYCTGDLLFIDSIQVKESHRNEGIGKTLLKKVIEKARKNGISGVHLLADQRKEFPKKWYEEIGLIDTGWAEYAADIKSVKL